MPKEFFIGIDLGIKEKKTTGICILEKKNKENPFIYCKSCQDIFGRETFKTIKPYLKQTKVIAIDAPLTIGKGKGKMRLYEKFLSTRIFRKEKVNPLPPALMPGFCIFAEELKTKLEKKGFVLDINLIEVFPSQVEKICGKNLISKILNKKKCPWQTENQKMALISALIAYLHFSFKTRYLGYKDGFMFLPETSFWKKSWIGKFFQAWQEKDRLKYRRLLTNIF